ncbi:polyphosphate kinase 2 [Sulfurovum mangrovi]|uniref:polyphosphate kinase 2 n=1 Tax=Sulfurovum mangrovi TaxID=2893889 RepID=UPI001E386B9F|nr:polyphosphate kinase 2 [Sulfurovum mangrovi]UFH58585.1 polyphosphate kinase 2 [Sulfurovum mangrovi]
MKAQIAKFSDHLTEHTKKHSKVFKKNGQLKERFYDKELYRLQHELVKLQEWIIKNDKRLLVIFEGMDMGGKSSTIKEFSTYLNPREIRSVALPKPNSEELGQWYFQRHIKQLPNAGEIVFFDRSWYNRAGIEQVFGYCTQEQHDHFYRQVNEVEKMLVDDEVMVFKFYLNITKKTQARRIKQREKDPLKNWKLSELDYKSHNAYGTYVKYRDKMFDLSGTLVVPWIELQADDKKRARLNALRFLLSNIFYEKRDMDVIKGVDEKILTLHS